MDGWFIASLYALAPTSPHIWKALRSRRDREADIYTLANCHVNINATPAPLAN